MSMFTIITQTNAQSIDVHVLIHGTRFSGLAFTSFIPFLRKKLSSDNLYTIAIKKSRCDVRLFDSQVMLERGLVRIQADGITQCRAGALEPTLSRRAAFHVFNGYDHLCPKKDTTNIYFTFGWEGLLEDKHRAETAAQLYNELVALRAKLQKEHPHDAIRFFLHGHSHGGNVILYLAQHETHEKKNLIIERACLYGTPIQRETAGFANHSMFKTVISYHSHGDHIQTADKFSTKSKTSERCLSSFVQINNTKNKKIIDVCVRVNGNTRALNHASFFFFDMYSLTGHQQNPALQMLNPLPIIMFAPTMLTLVDKLLGENHRCSRAFLDFNITPDRDSIVMSVKTPCGKHGHKSKNLAPVFNPIKAVVEKTWRPHAYAGTRNVTRLAFSGLFEAIPDYIKKHLGQK